MSVVLEVEVNIGLGVELTGEDNADDARKDASYFHVVRT
jgi:hypothetical protein